MSIYTRSRSIWHTLPLVSTFILKWHDWWMSEQQLHYRLAPSSPNATQLEHYPVDMWPLLALPFGRLDSEGVPYNDAPIGEYPTAYNTTTVAQYALALWNAYLTTGNEKHQQAFMVQAHWLIAHVTHFDEETVGWPMQFPLHRYDAVRPWLSALTQGNCISVLVRAYQLTHEIVYLQVAQRAVRTFERDIAEGGVKSHVGSDGIFFEEVAVYPAAHILNGYILALLGLYDYVACTDDANVTELIQHSLTTLHSFIDEFDMGYWSCYDLRFKRLSPRFYHALHVTLLEALARCSDCEHCATLAARWDGYQKSLMCRTWYLVTSLVAHCSHASLGALSKAYVRLRGRGR